MKRTAAIILMIIIIIIPSFSAYAADAVIHYGSDEYSHSYNENFYIGVYVESENTIGDYTIELSYDERFVTYLSGAESGENGKITLSGSAGNTAIKYMLRFRSVAGGDTNLTVRSAEVFDDSGEKMSIDSLPKAPIYLTPNPDALLTDLLIDEQSIDGFSSEVMSYELNLEYDVEELNVFAVGENVNTEVSDTSLSEGLNTIYLTVKNDAEQTNVYTIYANRDETPETTAAVIETTASAETQTTAVTTSTAKSRDPIITFLVKILVIDLAVMFVIIFSSRLMSKKKRNRQKKESDEKADRSKKAQKADAQRKEYEGLTDIVILDGDAGEEPAVEKSPPVISVQDVSMEFKLSTQNVSGIKEWVIRKIKGEINYRKFSALSHISFNVYKGEVVGIIGTNGSGKSTLLKIVSGALKATSGEVKTDRKKIQLLTFGTGFDGELTARENIYLNGAMIGYSREFIDENYDSIVKFAELEGFMEEKVKNFSSGMVSRLGFSIATAGNAAEILILDEVLAVGDEFFRKKSLARVKEMIHSGSTVLMVSHSMGTILDNCSKVVWIEKGKLKMVGEPKKVCAEYRKQKQ